MAASGVFAPGERVELIDGKILSVTPQGSRHATAVRLAEDALRRSFGPGFDVRSQLPLACSADSEPEPDVAVVRGTARDYRDAHPSAAELIIEVADSTLELDRERKSRLYARAGIRDYWIVDLIDGGIEVFRDAQGDAYRSVRRFRPGDCIAPLAAPDAEIAVADLLP